MNRRLITLNGIAIFTVVTCHAAGWGFTTMFWWAHRYRPVVSPNFDGVGSFAFYLLVVIQQLSVFAVPAFLFTAGAFMAYAVRGDGSCRNQNLIMQRIRSLVIPYLIWSLVAFIFEYITGIRLTPAEYLSRLFLGRALPAYYFVPLLIQMYLVSPFLVNFAVHRWRRLLVFSGTVQVLILALRYVVSDVSQSSFTSASLSIIDIFFGSWIFYFVLGIVIYHHSAVIVPWLSRMRKWLVGIGIISLAVSFMMIDYSTFSAPGGWPGPERASGMVFAAAFLLLFATLGRKPIPSSNAFDRLGQKSYGIFLGHYLLIEIAARAVYHVAPWILSSHVLLLPLLILIGIGIPVGVMTVIAKSPARSSYRFLFG